MINAVSNIQPEMNTKFDSIQTRSDNKQTFMKSAAQYAGANRQEVENKTGENSKKVNYDKLADSLKDFLSDTNLAIEFSIDEKSKKMIMKLVDNKTQEVVQQFPPEIALQVARIVSNSMEKNITDAKV